jgi:hypothetical protein
MNKKVLRVITRQNFIERQSYDRLVSSQIKTTQIIGYPQDFSRIPYRKVQMGALTYNDNIFELIEGVGLPGDHSFLSTTTET